MPRKSLCWDTYKSEVVVLDSSDDDDDVPSRAKKGKNGTRKILISSSESDSENLTSRSKPKFRINSESSSESDDCVVYSSDETNNSPKTSNRHKVIDLTLPKFSYETPDKKTSLKNRKLLRDISNRCGTPLKPQIDRGQVSVEDKLEKENKADRNNRLFDDLLGINTSEKEKTTCPVKVNDTFSNAFVNFHDIIKAKAERGAKDNDELGIPSDSFKKPTTFKKQKEISNKLIRPGDSKIVSRRTDDSDSTDHSVDSHRTPQKTPGMVKDLLNSLGPPAREPSPDPWSLPVGSPGDGDFYVKASPKPPVKRKGKTATYCFSDLKTALDDIEVQSGEQRSFLSSLDCSVTDSTCHPTARFYKDKFGKKKEELAAILFKMFNKDVFELKLPEDMTVEWSGRLTSSAGITHLSRKMVGGEWQFISRITLSKPIVTTAARLRDTLIHEMCHAAVWLLDRKKDGHGSYWKAWTFKAREAFPELLPISTCHSYSRNWKFTWECISCGYTIGRMTKSFDTQRFSCGRCHGRFELKENQNKTKRVANGFAKFVKANYASVKSDTALPHKEVMKMLSQRYQSQKANPNSSPNDPDDGDIEIISSGDECDGNI